MRYIIAILGLFSIVLPAFTQTENKTIYGIVTNEREELLPGATVSWKNTKIGTNTNADGQFWIAKRSEPSILVIQYVGYTATEVEIGPAEDSIWVEIKGITEIKTVEVTGHRFDNAVSTLNPRNVESIGKKELTKAPCCNLSESFQTNGFVDVGQGNAVTGVKEIQMMGLRGIYSQFLVENRPSMTGIAVPFAFEYIPGTWLENIYLAKGASSVKNGFNGITGQVNADLVRPDTDKPLFVNGFASTEGRGELNVHLNKKGNKVSHGLLTHGSFVKNRWDMNRDNFYDTPNRQQLNGLYRVFYDDGKQEGQLNIQALTDRRQSGQIIAFPGEARFGVDQRNDRVEVWGKYGRPQIGGKPYQHLGNMANASWHRTAATLGRNQYAATQTSLYWQSLLETIIDNTNHKIVFAPSVMYDQIQESLNGIGFNRTEFVPGAMAEYTFSRPNARMEIPDLVVVAGARIDWNSRFGWFFVPRMSLKYNFDPETVVRFSGGRGYRSPNLLAENLSQIARNYDPENSVVQEVRPGTTQLSNALHFANDLSYEEAWNYGINFTRNFNIGGRSGSFSADLYRTDFVRQILVDVDQSPTAVFFYNAPGPSFSNSALATLQYSPFQGFEVKLAAKWQDVRATFVTGELRTVPMVARYRGLVTVDYETPKKQWRFNVHTQIVGPQRLPDQDQIPTYLMHHSMEVSPVYALLNAQVTRVLNKGWEIYLGGENLTRYRQHDAIIAAFEPWSPNLNGSQVWAPMMGPIIYAGFRSSL
jgi:outer membrane receptor for ferrienterochelin and colicins